MSGPGNLLQLYDGTGKVENGKVQLPQMNATLHSSMISHGTVLSVNGTAGVTIHKENLDWGPDIEVCPVQISPQFSIFFGAGIYVKFSFLKIWKFCFKFLGE